MKKKIGMKNKIGIVIITLLLLLTTRVYAANDSFGTTINASASQVKRGDTITVTIGLKDIAIVSGEKGIGAYTASIKFDSSVLEYVSTNGTDKWEAPFYQNGLITGNTKDGGVVNTTQSIGTITFKVKKDATLGETTIGLTNFSGSTAVSDVSATDKSIKVTVLDNNANNNGNNNNGSQNNNGNNSNNGSNINNGGNSNSGANNNNGGSSNNGTNSNNSQNNSSNKGTSTSNTSTSVDATVKQGTLPKTGATDIVMVTIIGTCMLLSIVFFIKMTVLNGRMK